jgi:hypothetical protein
MTVAAATREAVRNRPTLYDALRAGVVNYTAAADSLDVEGDRDAIATALRRFAAELHAEPAPTRSTDRELTVRLHSDIESVDAADTLLAVDGVGVGQPASTSLANKRAVETESQTALRVTGDVDAHLLASTVDRLRIAGIPVTATGLAAGTMVLVVPRGDGPTALQLVEATADHIKEPGDY